MSNKQLLGPIDDDKRARRQVSPCPIVPGASRPARLEDVKPSIQPIPAAGAELLDRRAIRLRRD